MHYLLIVIAFFTLLSSCSTERASNSPAFSTGKPALLRSLDNATLSVDVQIAGDDSIYTGALNDENQWVVNLSIELDQTHQFVAKWYALSGSQKLLLVEQSGEFFASSTTMYAQPTTQELSTGFERFDVDCDGLSNLVELETDSDPLNTPGCIGSNGVVSDANTIVRGNTRLPELRELDGGCFQMGSPEFYPVGSSTANPYHALDARQHEVCVEPFAIGVYEVTEAQYSEFDGSFSTSLEPRRNLTWTEAYSYTLWLSDETGDTYRLPTEAEWEYAARGGTETLYWSGDQLRDDQENFNAASSWGGAVATDRPFAVGTLPVGFLEPNPFGLYDMLGNVIEYTCSAYSENYESGLENTCNDDRSLEYVHRGAAAGYTVTWALSYTRTGTLLPNQRDGGIGFRVVREIP